MIEIKMAYYRQKDWKRFLKMIGDPESMHETWERIFVTHLKIPTIEMKDSIFILGFIFVIFGCTDTKKANPLLNQTAKDMIVADSNESSFVYNESEAIWGFVVDTLTGNEELTRLKPFKNEALTGEIIEKIINKTWPRVQIKFIKTSNDTAFISIPDSEVLTQQMGSAGAEYFMVSTVYSFTEIKGVKYVSFDFEFGDHATPGVYNRNSWERNNY